MRAGKCTKENRNEPRKVKWKKKQNQNNRKKNSNETKLIQTLGSLWGNKIYLYIYIYIYIYIQEKLGIQKKIMTTMTSPYWIVAAGATNADAGVGVGGGSSSTLGHLMTSSNEALYAQLRSRVIQKVQLCDDASIFNVPLNFKFGTLDDLIRLVGFMFFTSSFFVAFCLLVYTHSLTGRAPIFVRLQTWSESGSLCMLIECVQITAAYVGSICWAFMPFPMVGQTHTRAPFPHPQSTKIGHFATYAVKGKLRRVRLRLSDKLQKRFFQ